MKNILRRILLFFTFLIPIRSNGQELPANFTLGIPKADTVEIDRLLKKSIRLGNWNTDSSLYMLYKVLEMSKRSGYKKGYIQGYLGVGIRLINKGNFTLAKFYLDSALYYVHTAQDTSLHRLKALVYNGLAMYHTNQGNSHVGLKYYYEILDLYKRYRLKDSSFLGLIYAHIGVAFLNMDQTNKAMAYLDRSRSVAIKTGDSARLADIMRYKAMVYQVDEKHEESENNARQAIDYYKRHNIKTNLPNAYYGLARNYLLQDEDSLALQYFQLAYAQDPERAQHNSALLQGLGGVNYKLGNYTVAEKYYKSAMDVCEAEGLFDDRLSIFSSLSKIYNATGQYKKAYENQVLFSELYDSLFNEEIARISNQLEVKYRLAEKDNELIQKENQLFRQENRIKEKNFWILGIGSGSLIVILLLVGLYRHKRHKARLQEEVILNLEKEKEIHILKARIEGEEEERNRLARDLHDGIVVQFSAVKMNLSVLPEGHPTLRDSGDYLKILTNLDNATAELRKTAHNLLPDSLLRNGLSEAVFYFCKDLEKSTGLLIDFQQYTDLPRLQAASELSIYRIIQELLQNVIKHAAAKKAIVQLSFNQGLLNVTVEDDGRGFDEVHKQEDRGIGMKNIYARASALGASLEIESRPESGASVYLELDILKSQLGAVEPNFIGE